MGELAILDYSTLEVHIYKINHETNLNEDYIRSLGHNPVECSWMFGENINVIKHK